MISWFDLNLISQLKLNDFVDCLNRRIRLQDLGLNRKCEEIKFPNSRNSFWNISTNTSFFDYFIHKKEFLKKIFKISGLWNRDEILVLLQTSDMKKACSINFFYNNCFYIFKDLNFL